MHFSRCARFSKTENIKEYFYLKTGKLSVKDIIENKFNRTFRYQFLSNYYYLYLVLDLKILKKKSILINRIINPHFKHLSNHIFLCLLVINTIFLHV